MKRMELIQSGNTIQIKRVMCSDELGITNCRYKATCPDCGKSISHASDEIFVDREVGGKHWVCVTFYCKDCNTEWNEELQLKVNITVSVVPGTKKRV